MNDQSTEVEQVAREILGHLRDHPNARDTLTGVAQWWFLHRRYLRGVELVQHALDLLVEQGHVERHTQTDGTDTFSARITASQVRNGETDPEELDC
jgi:hypothetical protein